jgi:hypothetical protein
MNTYNVSIYFTGSIHNTVEANSPKEAWVKAVELSATEPLDDAEEDGYAIYQISPEGKVVDEWRDDENPFDKDDMVGSLEGKVQHGEDSTTTSL